MKTKRRVVRIVFILALLLVFLLPSKLYASDLYEYYNTGDAASMTIWGNIWKAQTFTPSADHIITSVQLKLYRTGSPGTVTVSIRATDGNGHPAGGDLCSGTTDGNTLTDDIVGEWREITLGSGYALFADIKYAIVVRAPSGSSGNDVEWRMDYESPTYAGGCREDSVNSGSSWSSVTGTDAIFEEWGNAIASGNTITITGDPAYATAAPNVTAVNATSITDSGATLHGNITDDAGGHITMRGFEWGTETGNYTASWNETGEFEIGTFEHEISSLGFCTEIFWRAFAVNDYGQGNSTEQSFTTNCLPSAPTDFTVTQIGINSVNITWTPDPMADIVVIRVGEGECPDSVTGGTEVYSGNGTSVVVTGLMFEMTTYCYRAWSQNDYGYSLDYAEASIGNDLGLPTIMFVVGLCGFALWKREWLRVLLAIAVVMWGAFAMSYDVKIAAPLVAIGAALFFMGIFRVMKQAREET